MSQPTGQDLKEALEICQQAAQTLATISTDWMAGEILELQVEELRKTFSNFYTHTLGNQFGNPLEQ